MTTVGAIPVPSPAYYKDDRKHNARPTSATRHEIATSVSRAFSPRRTVADHPLPRQTVQAANGSAAGNHDQRQHRVHAAVVSRALSDAQRCRERNPSRSTVSLPCPVRTALNPVAFNVPTTHRINEHVHDLLAHMRECHAVLIGPSALLFIIQGPAPLSFTFCVPHAQSHQFIHHLVMGCAFRVQRDHHPGLNQGDYCQESARGRYPGVEHVVHLSRVGYDRRIFVIVAVTGTEAHPGVGSLPAAAMTSTVMFNYLTADGLVVAYPTLTLRRRSLFHIDRVAPCLSGVSMASYARVGIDYRIRPDNWDLDNDGRTRPCNRSWLSPCLRRMFGDAGCLVVSFDGRAVDAQGPGWVWGGVTQCAIHGHRMTRMHMPACSC